jgi:enediyne biosynthesis protein E4
MVLLLRAMTAGGCLLLVYGAPALAWKTNGGHRFAELSIPPGGKAGFSQLPASATGVRFTNVLTEQRGMTNQIFMSGSGVAAGDVDSDGWCDLYFCGLDSSNRLYRNSGHWKFEDVTSRSGIICTNQASTGAVFADIEGDGDLDLLVTGLGVGVRLFLNDGRGHFTERTDAAGLASKAGSMSMALGDIEGDGDLDLYVANYRTSTLQDEPGFRFRVSTTNNQSRITQIDGRPLTPEETNRYSFSAESRTAIENGEADFLYRNDGDGRFSLVSWSDGSFLDENGRAMATPYDWGLSVMFRDMNGDFAPDIYVCNDADSPDRIWLNDGRGRFRAMSSLAVRQICLASMGVDFADINRDGYDDFFVADMLSRAHTVRHTQMLDRRRPQMPGQIENRPQYMRNMLYLNQGDGTYAEIAQLSGVEASDWSWMPAFLDVDLDGYEDLLITTGLERSLRDSDARRHIDMVRAERKLSPKEFLELRRTMPRLATPNYAFRNRGDLTFEDVSEAWGFNSVQVSHGMATADLDNDGDLDVIVNCMNEPALLYRNDCPAPRVAVRLRGAGKNARGLGAKIKVSGGPVPQSQEMIAGGRYLSGDDATRVFAAGTNRMSIEVTWRDGTKTRVEGAAANRIYEVDQSGAARLQDSEAKKSEAPWFADVSHLINHRHTETLFNDFDRQPLLPRQFSQQGPGVGWSDLNGDGWDDLVVAGGRGSGASLFVNTQGRGFNRAETSAAADDQTTVLTWRGPQGVSMLAGISHYENDGSSGVARYEVWAGGVEVRETLPCPGGSLGPLALGDVDGDGDLDLFAGSRLVPGRYPEPAKSGLFKNDGNRFQPAQEFFGLVSSAVFSDVTSDGVPDLVLACDWGPVRIFRNQGGSLMEVTYNVGLGEHHGWWNSVTTGDFDEDGRLDIVAGNWGRNSKYNSRERRQLFFGDADDNGSLDVIEAYHDRTLQKVVPWARWDALMQSLPVFGQKFATFKDHSHAGVQEILGDKFGAFERLEVTSLDSAIFLNRPKGFEARALPVEAQFAPVFGICAADFDGDGHQDIFLAQNFFAVDAVTSRYDAGRGLILKGDGQGGFDVVKAVESGIMIYGQQRGAAAGDFDRDGRVDLCVAQNGAATKLYRNQGARAGLRLRLKGAAGNPLGIGAIIRNVTGEQRGPAQEVRAGGGYWSQDGATAIITSPSSISKVSVRWPGGKEMLYSVPAGAREITLAIEGNIDVAK